MDGRTKDVGESKSDGRTRQFFETEGHRFDFDGVKIVATEKLENSRRFMVQLCTHTIMLFLCI